MKLIKQLILGGLILCLPLMVSAKDLDFDANPTFETLTLDTGSTAIDILAEGTYTPTISNLSNISAATPKDAQWFRVGNKVTVSGEINIDPIATGASALQISLPVASTLTDAGQLSGVGAWRSSSTVDSILIYGGTSGNNVQTFFYASGTTAERMTYTFTYQVLQ